MAADALSDEQEVRELALRGVLEALKYELGAVGDCINGGLDSPELGMPPEIRKRLDVIIAFLDSQPGGTDGS